MPEMNREEIAKLEALYASNPEGRVFTHLAEAYRKGGEFERARSILEQGLTRHPTYASAHVVLGRVYADLNDTDQATASFRHVLELDPHNLVALRSLGELARSQGRTDEALAYFEELRHQDPSNNDIEGVIAELKEPRPPAQPIEVQAPAETWSSFEEIKTPGIEEDVGVTPAAQPEPWIEQPSSEPQPAEAQNLDTLPGFEDTTPDYGDLVSPDIDLGWSEPAAEQESLPGDLADFAALADASEPEPEPEPAVEMPLDISDLEQPEEPAGDVADPWSMSMDAAEPEAEPEPEDQEEPEPEEIVYGFEAITEELEPKPAAPMAAAEPAEPVAELPVVTETMAELFTEQGLFERAAEVYRALMNERPWDPDLPVRMADVEAKARGGKTPEPEKAAEPDEEVESPWTSPATGTADSPSPYAWAEEKVEATEAGPPISGYFQSLLSWRPGQPVAAPAAVDTPAPEPQPEPEPEIANFEAAPGAEDQPAIIELDTPVRQPELASWEAPAPAAFRATAQSPAPASQNDNPVEAAFDEWFNSSDFGEEAVTTSGEEQAPAAATEPHSGEGEDDDDLEMFRSWLQSLKK